MAHHEEYDDVAGTALLTEAARNETAEADHVTVAFQPVDLLAAANEMLPS